MSARDPRVLPVGDAAVTVEFGDRIDPLLAARVRSLDRSLEAEPFPGLHEAVPTYRSLLVVFDRQKISPRDVGPLLLQRARDAAPEDMPGRRHVIETVYGGEEGPDLAQVARARGLTEEQVVALHSGRDYTAFMLGFTPGFAYLGPLADELVVPRLSTPRPRIPAGSVAIAAGQTAVYPSASPGGWQILGRTTARLFDPLAEPPALIQPGDRVRFVPVEAPAREAERPSSPCAAPRPSSPPSLEVLEAGLLTTVQDAGRYGYRRWGVTWAGAVDAPSHASANLLVGNAAAEATLECTVAGPTLRFLHGALFAVTGADLGAVLERADLGRWAVPLGACVRARPGNVLTFKGRSQGCRAYVAFAGGIDVPAVLGSRATDLAAGFGGLDGRALRAGDTLALGHAVGAAAHEFPGAGAAVAAPTGSATLRVVLGPQAERFTDEALERFLSETYQLDATSDRRGCRLVGPPLSHSGSAEIVSDGMLPGAIQVPADGRPIAMLADSPTTGGYAKIATIVTADLPLLAQLLPGEGCVRFEVVAPEDLAGLP